MPLLDRIIDSALKDVADEAKHEEWVSTGFDETISSARGLLSDDATGELGGKALDKIIEHRSTVIDWGKNGLRGALTLVGIGKPNEAASFTHRLHLREKAGWQEIHDAIDASSEAGAQARRDMDKKRADILDTILDIGIDLARAALPLLLAA